MSTTDRMQDSTAPDVRSDIQDRTEQAIAQATAQDRVDERLAELEDEWDAERVLFTATGINGLLSLALGRWVDRRWYGYVAGVAAFQLQHGVQGWCPPMAVVRRLGFRTRREIDEERNALKAVRGDFDAVGRDTPAAGALRSARR
jgi:hypothetical protein